MTAIPARWECLAVFVGVSLACLFFLKPVIAALLAIPVLAQRPTALQVVAVLVVTA